MAELKLCPGPAGMLTDCEHGRQREHHYLSGPCNDCGNVVTVVLEGPDSRAEVKGFMCRDCMNLRRQRGSI